MAENGPGGGGGFGGGGGGGLAGGDDGGGGNGGFGGGGGGGEIDIAGGGGDGQGPGGDGFGGFGGGDGGVEHWHWRRRRRWRGHGWRGLQSPGRTCNHQLDAVRECRDWAGLERRAASGRAGGAIFNLNGEVTLDSGTIAFNTANSGGALYNLGYLADDLDAPGVYTAQATITNSILANSTGGAAQDVVSNAPVIVSGALPNITPSAVDGAVSNLVISHTQAGTGTFVGTPLTSDPMLSPLADNDGPTYTHALDTASPAFDTGATALAADQRGLPRPSGLAPDIGAFELQTAAPAGPPVTTPPVTTPPVTTPPVTTPPPGGATGQRAAALKKCKKKKSKKARKKCKKRRLKLPS